MSVESISTVLNTPTPDLTPTQRLILVGIANHDGDGGAWPSMATLARYAGVTVRAAQKAVATLVECGYITRHIQDGGTRSTPDHLRPNRYELHLTPRPTGHPSPVPQDTPPLSHRTPEPSIEPSMEQNPPLVPPRGDVEQDGFDAFWSAYPRKVSKAPARRKWARMTSSERQAALQALPAHIEAWKTRGDIQFVPHPATWLSQRRWEDEMIVRSAPTKAARSLDVIRRFSQGEL